MADTPLDLPQRACRCLNVRISPRCHAESPPDFLMATAGDADYALTYVGEQGISVAHPQVTMRTRKTGPPMPDSSRCIRFTTLTCLLCQTVTYRVRQLVACDVDLQEGPLLPSPDWVERETLLSICGWIEVHQDCLLAEDVMRLSSSPTYSPVFGIALPQNAISTAASTQLAHESSKECSAQMGAPVGPLLYGLKPLFPPAPFIPSHPIFTHLSSIAINASEHLRSLAEEQLAAIVRDKLTELEKVNDGLRHNVEELWRKFVENVGELEQQMGPTVAEARRRDSSRGLSSPTTGVSGVPMISIRNFVPTPSTAPRILSPSTSLPRVSSLSVSLATSGFHHARMVQESGEPRERSSSDSPRSPPPYSSQPSSLDSAESSVSSPLSSSPKLSPHMNGDSVMQPFKRSMDETRDTAASFRYFTILEADEARARQNGASQVKARSEDAPESSEPTQQNHDPSSAKATTPAKEAEEALAHPPKNAYPDATSPSPRQRKVKFDIKTEVVTGDSASLSINGETRGHEELIFDLEDGTSDPDSPDVAPVLPFIENAQLRFRGRHRVASLGVLPESLATLRPTSLPAYSILQPRVTRDHPISIPNSSPAHILSHDAHAEHPGQPDPQEEEVLKLVAANTPSHRSAWKRNSKAWQLFVSRRRKGVPGALIPEEVEDGSGRVANDSDDSDWGSTRDVRWSLGNPGFPTSLPVDISPLSRQREPLSLASYQSKTSLSDRAGMLVPAFPDGQHTSSTTLRKASHAKRDRSRAIDPGTLDFIAGDGEEVEEGESDAEPRQTNNADEGRGRQRALKILEARSKIPEAGMWMSLA